MTTYLSTNPVQRGPFAASTAYALGDVVLAPNGDLVSPVAAFTSGAAYNAPDWGVIVPAQNYGRELAGASSTANFTVASDSAWHDVPGLSMTVPGGVPYELDFGAEAGFSQGSAAAGAGTGLSLRVVDAATSSVVYGFVLDGFQFAAAAGSGAVVWRAVNYRLRAAALAAATTLKLQAQVQALIGLGSCGLFPGTFGGGCPTRLTAVGR